MALARSEIHARRQEIFSEGYNEDCVGPASYDLRLGSDLLWIGGEFYTDEEMGLTGVSLNGTHQILRDSSVANRNGKHIKIPGREFSAICSKEKLSLSEELCASVGLSLSITSNGLIHLIGPQIDPGFEGHFYALIYNASSEPVKVGLGQPILKMEVRPVEGNTQELNGPSKSPNEPDRPDGSEDTLDQNIGQTVREGFVETLQSINHTGPDLSELESQFREADNQIWKRIEHSDSSKTLQDGIHDARDLAETNEERISEIRRGYFQVVMFGVYLVVTSIFGVILTAFMNLTSDSSFVFGLNTGSAFIGAMTVGWFVISAIVVWAIVRGPSTTESTGTTGRDKVKREKGAVSASGGDEEETDEERSVDADDDEGEIEVDSGDSSTGNNNDDRGES